MPTYEYESIAPKNACKHCRGRFEIMQPISAKPLTKCPECGASIKRVPSLPRPPQTPFLSGGNLAKKGLTKLTKNCDGKYEISGGQKSKKAESLASQLKKRGID